MEGRRCRRDARNSRRSASGNDAGTIAPEGRQPRQQCQRHTRPKIQGPSFPSSSAASRTAGTSSLHPINRGLRRYGHLPRWAACPGGTGRRYRRLPAPAAVRSCGMAQLLEPVQLARSAPELEALAHPKPAHRLAPRARTRHRLRPQTSQTVAACFEALAAPASIVCVRRVLNMPKVRVIRGSLGVAFRAVRLQPWPQSFYCPRTLHGSIHGMCGLRLHAQIHQQPEAGRKPFSNCAVA